MAAGPVHLAKLLGAMARRSAATIHSTEFVCVEFFGPETGGA